MGPVTGRRSESVEILAIAALQLLLTGTLAALGIFAAGGPPIDGRTAAICMVAIGATVLSIASTARRLRWIRHGRDDAPPNDASPQTVPTELVHRLSQPLNVISLAAFNALAEIEAAEPAPAATTDMDDQSHRLVKAKLELIHQQVDRASRILMELRASGPPVDV